MVGGAETYFDDHKELKDLGRLALRGGIVSIAMQYGTGALQLAASVVLARLLTPEDFGLVAIVIVLTSFAPMLIDFGLGEATAQRSRITPSQISSLFWFSTASGVTVAVVVAACSPLIATIFREPKLGPIAMCAAISFVLMGSFKSAPGASAAHNAVWRDRPNTNFKHLCGSYRRNIDGSLRIRLLGAGAAPDCNRALRCLWVMVSLPLEARIACIRQRSEVDDALWNARGRICACL